MTHTMRNLLQDLEQVQPLVQFFRHPKLVVAIPFRGL